MRKQCVPGSFFSAHAQELGNEATSRLYCRREITNFVLWFSPCGESLGTRVDYHADVAVELPGMEDTV